MQTKLAPSVFFYQLQPGAHNLRYQKHKSNPTFHVSADSCAKRPSNSGHLAAPDHSNRTQPCKECYSKALAQYAPPVHNSMCDPSPSR